VPSDNEPGWPSPLELAAFRGVACDFITALLPETEADTAGHRAMSIRIAYYKSA